MKKVLAILLALLFVFALFGCDDKATVSQKPTGDDPVTSASPADSGAKPEIVYICNRLTIQWCQDIADTIASFQDEYDFDYTYTDSGNDNDKFVTLVETFIEQKVDGFILNCNEDIAERVNDAISETDIPYLFESTAQWSNDGTKLLTAGVELNAYDCGAGCSVWLGENYKTYLGEITDWTKVGFIPVTYSSIQSFMNRSNGATDAWLEAFPECTLEDNVYVADLVKQGASSAEAAYQEVAAIVSGNPGVEYWMIVGILDDYGQGATRAVEAAGKEANTIVASVGGEVLVLEWDQGYEGCWKMCNFFQAMDYSELLVPALLSLIKGEASVEDLWPDWKVEGQELSSVKILGEATTKETYGSLDRWTRG